MGAREYDDDTKARLFQHRAAQEYLRRLRAGEQPERPADGKSLVSPVVPVSALGSDY